MSTPTTVSKPRSRAALLGATRLFNPVVLLLAGTPLLPLYGVLQHRGRRSGKAFRTPVVVRPIEDGFIVPMPWGERTDWYRNVRAAGECVIRWKGRDYPLAQPEVLDATAAHAAFGPVEQAALVRFGISQCLRLHHRTLNRPAAGGV
jgi:deazaflavin-dependent oxidoreductase (nitroreductase family)